MLGWLGILAGDRRHALIVAIILRRARVRTDKAREAAAERNSLPHIDPDIAPARRARRSRHRPPNRGRPAPAAVRPASAPLRGLRRRLGVAIELIDPVALADDARQLGERIARGVACRIDVLARERVRGCGTDENCCRPSNSPRSRRLRDTGLIPRRPHPVHPKRHISNGTVQITASRLAPRPQAAPAPTRERLRRLVQARDAPQSFVVHFG